MSKSPLFPTRHLFTSAVEAVEFFNSERVEGVDPIGPEVTAFLETIEEYDPDAVFNVQPAFRTHYVSVAVPGNHHAWLFARASGVTFAVGDARNTEAVLDMWPPVHEWPESVSLTTDVWFGPDELTGPAPELCLRLAASWAEVQVRSRP